MSADHQPLTGELSQDDADLWWAAGYNIFAVALASGSWRLGVMLSPAVGAVLMSSSPAAQLLRRVRR